MNKHKVTLSESNPPRIGDELEIGGKIATCTSSHGDDTWEFTNPSFGEPIVISWNTWLGMTVIRTEEEDGV